MKSIGYPKGLDKMTIEGEHGQFSFSDEELGINKPIDYPEKQSIVESSEAESTPEETGHKPEKVSDIRTALLSVEVGMILDPHPPKGEEPKEISIHKYLLREVGQGWQKCQYKAELARIIADRFNNDPENVRRLAEAYQTEYISHLEKDIELMRQELAESYDKNDLVYNPQATAHQDRLRLAINEAERNLEHQKLVANDIAFGLKKIADLL